MSFVFKGLNMLVWQGADCLTQIFGKWEERNNNTPEWKEWKAVPRMF